MDLTDKKILCELDMNCRTPISQMAHRLRISRSVASYRIARLQEEGFIQAYICTINLGRLGYKTYKVYLKTTGEDDALEQYLKQHKMVIHCLKTEGAYDYSIAVAAGNLPVLDGFLMDLKGKFKSVLREYFISMVVYSKIFKLDKLLLGKQAVLKMEQYSGEDARAEIDEKDKAILRVLSQQANISVVDIAAETRLSIDVVKYRMKALRQTVVNSYRAIPSISKLGLHHYVVMLRTRAMTRAEETRLVAWCAAKQNVLYCSKKIGPFDFEINAAIGSIDELSAFLASLKAEFSGSIESHELVINTKLLKLNYAPF